MADKKQIINMFWFKMPNGENNFGDLLGPYIVHKLSGQDVRNIPIVDIKFRTIASYLFGIIKNKFSIRKLFLIIPILLKQNVLITVGSIIPLYNKKKCIVWGSGIIDENDKITNANFCAVRGKYTQKKLYEFGYKVPETIGDPALLLPLLIKPSKKKYRLGIIPHYVHYDEVVKANLPKDILIINLVDDIEKVVNDITSCEMTISTSLHGLIVSHAYQISSLWVKLSETKLAGNNVKFNDYFSSVGISEYLPFYFNLNEMDIDRTIRIIIDNHSKTLIRNNLESIQKDLIKVAPFQVLGKYKS